MQIILFTNPLLHALHFRAFLRDVVETANVFIKMMERFCQGEVVVQDKRRAGGAGKKKKQKAASKSKKDAAMPTEVSQKRDKESKRVRERGR